MARKKENPNPVHAYWTGQAERERGITPGELDRRPWRPGQRCRALHTSVDPDDGAASVWVEHRDEMGLAFKVEVGPGGQVVGFHVRPLVFESETSTSDAGSITLYVPDDVSVPDGAEHLTARRVRNLPVGEVCDAALAGLRRDMGSLLKRSTSWRETMAEARRPGRRGRPDRFYAEVAADYVTALRRGDGVEALADGRGLSASQVRNLLYEARRRDVLTPAPRGRAGGELTDKARRLLDGEHQEAP